MDLKQIFESGQDSFELLGFTFQKSETNINGDQGTVFFCTIGANDSMSTGYAIELDAVGLVKVYRLRDNNLVEQIDHSWSSTRLIDTVKRYEKLMNDVREEENTTNE